MSTEFQVGDLVVMQNGKVFTECDGLPAVVIEVGRERQPFNLNTMKNEPGYFYKVKVMKEVDELTVDKGELLVRPWQIRPLNDSHDQELVKELQDAPATVEDTLANK
jgi:hypothetical protein